jgi:methionyl-tRNA formyltransferase
VDARPLATAFLGNDAWSVPALRALAGSAHPVRVVLTYPPRPAGRGSRLRPTPVADAARELRLPVVELDTVRRGPGREAIDAARPDVLVVVAYGELLNRDVLEAAPLGAVNVHFSLLPALRGASPVQRALLDGLQETGVTTMRMDEGLDTGPILLQAAMPIEPDDDAGSLGARLADLGGELVVATLDGLADGSVRPVPQDDGAATTAPKLTAADRVLDWSHPAPALVRRVRALGPDPAATTRFRGAILKIYRASATAGSSEPGTITDVDKEGLSVAAGDGALRLLEVAPAGRTRMSGAEFVRGYRPRVGERLG